MKRPGWSRDALISVWSRMLDDTGSTNSIELYVRRHARRRFTWSASAEFTPDAGRTEVTDVGGYAGTLAGAQIQAERAARFLCRPVPE